MRKTIFLIKSSAISYCPVCMEELSYRDSCKRILLQEGHERHVCIIRRDEMHENVESSTGNCQIFWSHTNITLLKSYPVSWMGRLPHMMKILRIIHVR